MDYVTRPGARVIPGDGTCDAPGPRAGPGGFSEGLTRAPGRARALPFYIINRAGPGGYPGAARPGRCPCLAVHKRFVALFVQVFALFVLLGGGPRRLELPRHFSEDHGSPSRFSHTSKRVDARWSTRATKHIGEEYRVNTRKERMAGGREKGAGIP